MLDKPCKVLLFVFADDYFQQILGEILIKEFCTCKKTIANSGTNYQKLESFFIFAVLISFI